MLKGRLLAESSRVGMDLEIADLTVVRLGRHDVSESTTPFEGVAPSATSDGRGATTSQPSVWTFADFMRPTSSRRRSPACLNTKTVGGPTSPSATITSWSSPQGFRYRIGDVKGRNEAIEYGVAAGTPRHQLDWGD